MPAEVPVEPVVSIEPEQPDISTQVADKIQEIRFYISQEMWEQAKAAILDLTELAPDAPEVTELIAEISAGQAKGRHAAGGHADRDRRSSCCFCSDRSRGAFCCGTTSCGACDRRSTGSCTASGCAGPGKCSRHRGAAQAKVSQSSATPAAQAAAQSTEDILGDFLQDLEKSDLADFAPKEPHRAHVTPAPAMAAAQAPVIETLEWRHEGYGIRQRAKRYPF